MMDKIQTALLSENVAEAMLHWNDATRREASQTYEFGCTLFNMYYYDEADLVFAPLLTKENETHLLGYLLGVAKLWFGVGKFEISSLYSRRAFHIDYTADNAAMHASNLVRSEKKEEAERLLLDTINREPGHARSVRLLAHVERTSGRQKQAKQRLEDCLLSYPSDEDWRLQYELGYILDRQGDYQGAMRVMLKAKSALQATANSVTPEWRARAERQWQTTNLLDTDRLTKWHSTKGGEDVVIMAGFPRSGTTLLENIISTHESCLGTDETGVLNTQFTEPIVFGASSAHDAVAELDDFYDDELAAGRDEYYRCTEAIIGEARNGRTLLEKEPLMTADLALPLRLFPQCKIIMPLRDPRDVVISFFFTIVPLTANSAGAISIEQSCKYYAEVMRHWLLLKERLPKARWMESRYEDLLADAESQTKKLAKFLNIDWHQNMLEHHKQKSSKAITTPTYSDVSKALYTRSTERWRNYEQELKPHLHHLEPYIEKFGYAL